MEEKEKQNNVDEEKEDGASGCVWRLTEQNDSWRRGGDEEQGERGEDGDPKEGRSGGC